MITGVTREQYAALRGASEAVFREALALLASYGEGAGRPKLSEIHVDPRAGFSLVLLDGAGEVRLGRGGAEEKLARFDQILAAPARAGLSAPVGGLPGRRAGRSGDGPPGGRRSRTGPTADCRCQSSFQEIAAHPRFARERQSSF